MRTPAKQPTASTGALSSEPGIGATRSTSAHGSPGAARGAASGGEGGPEISRRSMVAAVAATVVPVTPVLGAGASGPLPDAELIALGRRYLDLIPIEAEAIETYNRCRAASRKPERPDVMREREGDCELRLKGRFDDPRQGPFYSKLEISRLRSVSPPFDRGDIPKQRARIAEIQQGYETWTLECDAADRAAGVDAAVAALDEVINAMGVMENQMLCLPAKTLAGFRIRGLVVQHMLKDRTEKISTTDELTILAMIHDLVSIEAT